MKDFGKEVIIDLHQCSTDKFSRLGIQEYFDALCEEIEMEQCDLHFWDYQGQPEEYAKAPDHLKGISAIQFITTSNITVHTLDATKRVYLNIFSCKEFDAKIVISFSEKFFNGIAIAQHVIRRV